MASPTPEPAPSGPACTACGAPALVNWTRRLTDTELADYVALEQERRDERLLLADPQQPPPDFGPLPQAGECTHLVLACGAHAIDQDLATRIHAKTCTAPNPANLPACDCTPEPLPAAAPAPDPQPMQLPAHWTT